MGKIIPFSIYKGQFSREATELTQFRELPFYIPENIHKTIIKEVTRQVKNQTRQVHKDERELYYEKNKGN